MRLVGILVALLLILPFGAEAKRRKKKKNKDESAGPRIGWVAVGEAGGQCYFPPDFDDPDLNKFDRRQKRAEALNEILGQWSGNRNDGVSFDPGMVESVRTVLLGTPERIEGFAQRNAEQCEKAMTGGGVAAWETWAEGARGRLTEGDCPTPPMEYTAFDYLQINNNWQIPISVCKNDRVIIKGTKRDQYRLTKDGPWMNVAGTDGPTEGLPCSIEGCKRGMLIMKFRPAEGPEVILPVGEQTEFTAPNHGEITVMVNDDQLSDNEWRMRGRVQDHTSIEISAADQ